MRCDVCGHINGHDDRCPEYNRRIEKQLECCVCGEYIIENDKYVTNENGESRHTDCYENSEELIIWLGYEIKRMEEKDNGDY